MKRAGLLALGLVLLAVPAGVAHGFSAGWDITSGTVGDNGWYRSAVSIKFTVTGTNPGGNCPAVWTQQTNDQPPLKCTASDDTGSTDFTVHFKIDKDAPSVTAMTPARAPDANGWFNKPVALSFSGSDATSGIASWP